MAESHCHMLTVAETPSSILKLVHPLQITTQQEDGVWFKVGWTVSFVNYSIENYLSGLKKAYLSWKHISQAYLSKKFQNRDWPCQNGGSKFCPITLYASTVWSLDVFLALIVNRPNWQGIVRVSPLNYMAKHCHVSSHTSHWQTQKIADYAKLLPAE